MAKPYINWRGHSKWEKENKILPWAQAPCAPCKAAKATTRLKSLSGLRTKDRAQYNHGHWKVPGEGDSEKHPERKIENFPVDKFCRHLF